MGERREVQTVDPLSEHTHGGERRIVPVRVKSWRSRQRSRKLYLLISIFLLVFVSASVFSVIEYQAYDGRYHRDIALEQAGAQHLQKAETLLVELPTHPLDAQIVGQAQQEFASASTTFAQLNNDLRALPGFATQIPVYGTRLNAALRLVPLAHMLAQDGVTSCDILSLLFERLHDPLNPQTHGITIVDLAAVAHNIHQIRSDLAVAMAEISHLPSSVVQFDPRISKLLGTFHKDVPMLQGWLDDVEKLLPVAPTLLGIGVPTHYLLEVLDSTELRPGGGFIGNYGIATFSGGRLIDAHITDVDLLDRPFEAAGNSIPYPSAYTWFDIAPRSWSLRDTNLDADFPTAARYSELNYTREGGTGPVQGVIAITPVLIQHALTIIGPINIPEYHETVTAQNLIDRIHYHQLGPAGEGSDRIASPDGYSSLRKHFTALLAEHFLARVRQLMPSISSKFLQLMINGMRSKDIQIYFNVDTAEALLHRSHLDAAIQSSAGDDLFVVDANIAANKANSFITNTLTDMMTIDPEGNVVHHLTLRYAWMTQGPIYSNNPTYRDYMQVYIPSKSVLQVQDGWQSRGKSGAFNHEVWAGFFTLLYGQTRPITLIWTVPHAATRDSNGWHYQYLIQRQAGTRWMLHLQVTLPSGALLTSTSGGQLSHNGSIVALSEFLNEDVNMGIDYAFR